MGPQGLTAHSGVVKTDLGLPSGTYPVCGPCLVPEAAAGVDVSGDRLLAEGYSAVTPAVPPCISGWGSLLSQGGRSSVLGSHFFSTSEPCRFP